MTDPVPATPAERMAAELRRQAETILAVADRIVGADPASSTSDGARLIAAERERQIAEEGYDPEHDTAHAGNELAWAAWCYLERAAQDRRPQDHPSIPTMWPFKDTEWKPKPTRERNLAVAGALIAAEIDRDRGGGVIAFEHGET